MSGIELAGLIIAILPLVSEGLEKSEKGLASMQDWWRYRIVFKSFQHEVDLQTLLLRQQLENLLGQVVSSSAQLAELLNEPRGAAWSNKELDARLRRMLPENAYQCYMQTARYAFELLDKLRTKFGVVDESVRVPQTSRRWNDVVRSDLQSRLRPHPRSHRRATRNNSGGRCRLNELGSLSPGRSAKRFSPTLPVTMHSSRMSSSPPTESSLRVGPAKADSPPHSDG
jgi:hypothetical protein